MRYFSPWKGERIVEDFYLPRSIQKIAGQKKTRIGDALISTRDSCVGSETCEELFTPRAPGIGAGLDGCEIMSNSSGSHHELRKLNTRIELIREATLKAGGIYLYANRKFIPSPHVSVQSVGVSAPTKKMVHGCPSGYIDLLRFSRYVLTPNNRTRL